RVRYRAVHRRAGQGRVLPGPAGRHRQAGDRAGGFRLPNRCRAVRAAHRAGIGRQGRQAWPGAEVHGDLRRDPPACVDPLAAIGAASRRRRGGEGSKDALKASVRIPGLYSLTVDDLSPTLVDNDKYEPEQVLVANFGGAVRGSDVADAIRAWVLPAQKPGEQPADDGTPYDWGVSEVGENVLRKAQSLLLVLAPTENDYQALQSFKYHAVPGQRVYVRIGKGIKSFGGYVL